MGGARLIAPGLGLVLAFVGSAVATDVNLIGTSDPDGEPLARIDEILWAGLAALLVVRALCGRLNCSRPRVFGHDYAYLGWLAAIGASVFWSVSPKASLIAAVPLALVGIAAMLIGPVPTADVVRVVLVVACLIAVLSLGMIVIDSDLAYQPFSSTGGRELRGVFRHQLRLGSFMALALGLLVVARMRGDLGRVCTRSKLVNTLALAVLLLVLVLARARTYTAAAALALTLALLLSRRGARRKWAVIIVGVTVALVVFSHFDDLRNALQNAGFDTTLTGRTDIWARSLRAVTPESQWLGYGFGTLRLPTFDYLYPPRYRASHAHNSLIQAHIETGIVGLTALLVLIVAQLASAWRFSTKSNTYSYSLFLVLYSAIAGLTGLTYSGTTTTLYALMLLFLAIECREMEWVSASEARNAAQSALTPT